MISCIISALGTIIGNPTARVPYTNIEDGAVTVRGLPDSITHLKRPSCYGREKLQALLDCTTITFEGIFGDI
jgi:hypothetical protein